MGHSCLLREGLPRQLAADEMRLFACFPFAAVVLSLAAVVAVVEARSQVTPPPLQNGVYRNLENAGIAVRLYHEIAKVEKQANVFFSPVGLSGVMGMIGLAAKGAASDEMNSLFEMPSTATARGGRLREKSTFGETYEFIRSVSSKNVSVKTESRVFVDGKLKVFDSFTNALRTYEAHVQKVEFSRSTKLATTDINKWANTDESRRHQRFVSEHQFNRETKMLFANKITFHGHWHSQFHPGQSDLRPFYVTHHDHVNVHMMFQRGKFRYAFIHELALHVLELPYEGKEMSMLIFLPDNFDIPIIEAALSSENLDKWLATLEYKTVEVVFPKFELTMNHQMSTILKNLGMTSLFDASKCDVSGMLKQKAHVDEIMQQASIEIGDKGGAVEAERSEAKRTHTDDVVLVYVDHPFLMMIRSNPTPQKFTIAQILAIGKYALPNGRIVFGRDEL